VSDTSPPSAAGFTPLTSSDVPDTALIEQLRQKLDATEQKLGTSEQRLQFAELKIQLLEERLRQMLINKYGPSSEKLSSAQLQLLELEPGVSSGEVEAESEREALPSATEESKSDHKIALNLLSITFQNRSVVIGILIGRCFV